MSGDWDRDLAADLETIKSSGAKALVTLMENDELTAVQVPLTELAPRPRALDWNGTISPSATSMSPTNASKTYGHTPVFDCATCSSKAKRS